MSQVNPPQQPPPNQPAPPVQPPQGGTPPPTGATPPPAGPPPPPGSLGEAVRRLLSPSLLSHLLLVLLLLLTVAVVHWISLGIGQDKSKKWLCQIEEDIYADCKEATSAATPTPTASPTPRTTATPAAGNTAVGATPSPTPSPTPAASPTPTQAGTNGQANAQDECGQGKLKLKPEQTSRLEAQLVEIKRLVKFHGDVMAYFFSVYYLSISMILFGGVIVAVALFFIAQNGWGPTNPYVKTVFVVMAAVTAYYGLFPPVFQQEKNISDNTALFLEYQTLRREVESYPQTCANGAGEPKEPGAFITYVNSEMRRLGKIAIGFDYSKIDYKGAFDLSREPTKPAGSDGPRGGGQNPKK